MTVSSCLEEILLHRFVERWRYFTKNAAAL
jgi:hypothetical protein